MSVPFKLNREDMYKVFTGLCIALVGAGATYWEATIPNIDFGQYTPVIVAANSMLVNLIRKLLTQTG